MCDRWQLPPAPTRVALVDEGPDRPMVLTVYDGSGATAAIELDARGAVNLARQLLDAAARRLS